MSKYIINIIVIMCLCNMSYAGTIPKPCKSEEELLKQKNLDLDTKTLKGWVRLLKNRSKMGEYGVVLTKEETIALIKCITIELDNRQKVGKLI